MSLEGEKEKKKGRKRVKAIHAKIKEQVRYCIEFITQPIYKPREVEHQGLVVQSIVSLTSSLRVQLVKYFTTSLPNTLIFFVEKMREAFALRKLLTFFQQKILPYLRNKCLKF